MAVSVEAALSPNKTVIWGAPTFDQVRVAWGEAKRAATGVAEFNHSLMTATFPGGGRIIYRSLDDPDNARGHTADGIVIDEAADVVELAWYEVLRPMLIDTGGWLWALGTPKGRNWFWREFVMAGERPDSRAWNAPTLGCELRDGVLTRNPHPLENPNIPFTELEQMHRTMPERTFRQEILAEFIEDSGGVFRKVNEAVDRGRVEPDAPEKNKRYVIGVDLARVQDFTVITALDAAGRQAYHERFNQISWERQIARIGAASKQYPGLVVVDSTGVGDPICETLRRNGVPVKPYHFNNQTKEAAVDRLALRLEQGRIRLMDVPEQTNELLAFEYELTPSRNVRMNAPEGMHDDCVIALALAAWGSERYARTGPTDSETAADAEARKLAEDEARKQHLFTHGWH
jgi:hypothetical protein